MKIKRIYLLFLFFIALHSYGVKAQVCDELIPICSSQDGLDNNAVDESPIDINTTCQDLQGTRTAWYYILIEEATVIPLYYDYAVRLVSNKITGMSINGMNSLSLKTVKKKPIIFD